MLDVVNVITVRRCGQTQVRKKWPINTKVTNDQKTLQLVILNRLFLLIFILIFIYDTKWDPLLRQAVNSTLAMHQA